MKTSIFLRVFLAFFLAFSSSLYAQKIVYKINIKDEISPSMVRQVQMGFKQAAEMKADLILLHMNTYGGLVISADSIRTKILNSKIPIIVFIDNNAASAGALISIACDSIYMRSGANIGAATVVNENAEAMPDKYQSYMRSTMRSTAEAKHRNPKIAEAMVDPDVYIPGIIDSGKVLTFTAAEAISNGYCEGIAENCDQVLRKYGYSNYKIEELKLSAMDELIGFLMSPALQSIFIILIVGGIWFELQAPGFGFPSVVAITGALLYFAPLYLGGLAENWEILLFMIGVVLLALEIFVIPGFGVAGILGIVAMVSGLILSLLDNVDLNFDAVSFEMISEAFFLVILSIFGAVIVSFVLTKKVLSSRKIGFALFSENSKNDGFSSADVHLSALVGKVATAQSMLRPSGKIRIDYDDFDAVAETGFIEKGSEVDIIGYQNAQLIVRLKN